MYHEYTQEQLRAYCRNCIETVEIWARRLIHEKMTAEYGPDYINYRNNDEPIVKKEVRNRIAGLQRNEPDRIKRPVDALFIDDIVYFLCNPKFYNKLFKEALDYTYPLGKDHVRHCFNKLIKARNPLSHSNPITIRQAEQVICYSHDFIDGLKEYYKSRGEEQVWNVPRIIKFTDSLGNVFEPEESSLSFRGLNSKTELKCGDEYSLEVEIDSSFNKDEYTINWRCFRNSNNYQDQTHIDLKISEKDVSASASIECTIVSNKPWHKYGSYDDRVLLKYTVLPPG